MAEAVNGGPARSYRRHSLAEQRGAFQIATAQVAVLQAKAEQITADAEVRINRIDLQILRLNSRKPKPTPKSDPR